MTSKATESALSQHANILDDDNARLMAERAALVAALAAVDAKLADIAADIADIEDAAGKLKIILKKGKGHG